MIEPSAPHILFAYHLDDQKGATQITDYTLEEKVKSSALTWVNLNANSEQAKHWLDRNVPSLDSVTTNALLATETRPRMSQHKDGILLILRGVNLNENSEPEDMISIRLWIEPARIISVQMRPLKAVNDLCNKLENGLKISDPATFMVQIITNLFLRMEPVMLELDDRTDNIEEQILEHTSSQLRSEIIDVRKKTIVLRRYIAPQREALNALRLSNTKWIKPDHHRHIQENIDRLSRYIEDLDAIRERTQIIKDEIANIMADRMNKNMYILSIIAAIFLPLGFLTGLLGINVGGMPGADYDMAFWIVCILCVFFGAGILALFKRLKWI